MPTPTVSVVVPVFNGLTYLPETVASIQAQTHPDIEIVLVDGGSTDGSREWIEAFEHPRVVKDYLPAGTPAAATWTRASELGAGTFVKLLCQDDLIYPAAIEKQVVDLQGAPSAGMAIFQRDMVSASGKVLYRGRGCAGLPNGRVDGRHALEVGSRKGANVFGEPLAVLFRREAMADALPWEDEQPFLLDMFFYAKVLRNSDLVVRRESLGAFRISTSSWSTRLAGRQSEQFRAWQQHVESVVPQPWYRVAQARLNNERTTLMRRGAYWWLHRKGDM